MIIGLTGSYCSGKDTVADYIVKNNGFIHFSLSDEIRLLMKQAGIEPTRENLIVFGTKLRKENGNGVLAKSVMAKFEENKNYCITSIRHSEEVKTFKTLKNFVLVNVDAPQDVRFARMQLRKRPGLCCQMADIIFTNNEPNLQELYKKIDILLKDLKSKFNK